MGTGLSYTDDDVRERYRTVTHRPCEGCTQGSITQTLGGVHMGLYHTQTV